MAEERKEGTQVCAALTSSGNPCKRQTRGEFCDTHSGQETEPEQTRTTREQDSRKADSRPSDTWMPASTLPMPDPQPGWVFRYVRVSSLDSSDIKNVSKRFREGWEAVKAGDYPELNIVTDMDSRWADSVEIGGLLLCKIPKERMDARKDYYRTLNADQLRTADSGFMNEDLDPRMPKYNDSKTRTSFRKG